MSDNRGLVLAVAGAAALTATAALVRVSSGGHGGARSARFEPVAPVVTRSGAVQPLMKGPIRVTLTPANASDEVVVHCGSFRQALTPKDGVVVFTGLPQVTCEIALHSNAPPYSPVYPGDELECMWLEHRTLCVGGVATKMPAHVGVDSAAGGVLSVDGGRVGALPLSDLRFAPGSHEIVVELEPGVTLPWTLLVSPNETVQLAFPAPAGYIARPSAQELSDG